MDRLQASGAWFALALAGVPVVSASGCKAGVEVRVLPDESPSRRAAASFVHCIESGTSQCVRASNVSGGWDAFYLLAWLADGSPVSILSGLEQALTVHEDPRGVQGRLVAEVERYASSVRGAQCMPAASMAFPRLIDEAARAAHDRLARFGLLGGKLPGVVDGLRLEAEEELKDGELVRLDCGYDPYRLYVATAGPSSGAYRVVGMSTMLPTFLGGDVPAPAVVDERLRSAPLGLDDAPPPLVRGGMNPWLPFEVELF